MYPTTQFCRITRHTRSMSMHEFDTETQVQNCTVKMLFTLCPIAGDSIINLPANELYQDKMDEKS